MRIAEWIAEVTRGGQVLKRNEKFSFIAQAMNRYIFTILFLSIMGCQQSSDSIENKGVGERQAVQLLVRAQNANQQTQVIEKIKADFQFGFEWNLFWDQVRQENLIQKLPPQQRSELLGLFALSCSEASHEAFARVVLSETEQHSLIHGKSNQCSFALPEQLYIEYFAYYKSQVLAGEKVYFEYFAQLISRQIQGSQATPLLRNSFDTISAANWSQIVVRGIELSEMESVMLIVAAYENIYGSYELADTIIKPALILPDQFSSLLNHFGFIRTLDLLQRIPETYYKALHENSVSLEIPLQLIVQAYASQVYRPLDTSTMAEQAYRDFVSLSQFIELVESNVSYPMLFDLTQTLFSSLETWIATDRVGQVYSRFEPSVFLYWVKYRLRGEVTVLEAQDVIDKNQTESSWRLALQDMLIIHLQNDQDVAHERIQQLCVRLENLGVLRKQISATEFSPELLQSPGCLELVNASQGEQLTIETEKFDMNLMSIFLTSGVSLNIKAQHINASIIDLTNTQRHPDLPPEVMPNESNAVVFPVLLGLQIQNDTGIFAPGFYYFVSHFTWREAADGVAAQSIPLVGFQGGNLVIDSTTITPFRALSLGGEGQKAAPSVIGGLSDHSSVNKMNISLELGSITGNFPTRQLLHSPDIRTLKHLLQHAERNADNRIRVYTDTDIAWRLLDEEQKPKVAAICQLEIPDQACFHRLAEQAIQQVVLDMRKAAENFDENYVIERLSTNTYIEPSGELGPNNIPGAQGANGSLIINGEEQ